MSTDTIDFGAETVKANWRTLATAGGVVALIGLLALFVPFATGIALSYLLGIAILFGGIVHAGHAITVPGWTSTAWQATLAVVSVTAGLVLLVNPIVGLVALTIVVISYLLADGLVELWTSIRMGRGSGRGWIAASGVLSLVLAAFLWAGFPADALWVAGVVVGVSLLTTGLSMVAVAYGGRHVTSPTGEPRRA